MSGREDWLRRMVYFGFFGALGWSFGGSISYMQVIGYTHSGDSLSVLYGFACLFVIGFAHDGLRLVAPRLGLRRIRVIQQADFDSETLAQRVLYGGSEASQVRALLKNLGDLVRTTAPRQVREDRRSDPEEERDVRLASHATIVHCCAPRERPKDPENLTPHTAISNQPFGL